MATPKIKEGLASESITLVIIDQVPAPIDKAASIKPHSISFSEVSTRRATKGMAAKVSGTMEATVPIYVPTSRRVMGIIKIKR